MRRGQGAVEFAILTTVIMILFSSTLILAESRFIDAQTQNFELLVKQTLDQIEGQIILADLAGPGYERNFSLPNTLIGKPYNISINDNVTDAGVDELVLWVEGEEYLRFITIDINGSVHNGDMSIHGGEVITITTLP